MGGCEGEEKEGSEEIGKAHSEEILRYVVGEQLSLSKIRFGAVVVDVVVGNAGMAGMGRPFDGISNS